MSIASPIFGIDVSHWNSSVRMRQVKAEGYDFAIIKATEGPYRDGSTYTDPSYRLHMNNAKSAGLIVGAYHFLLETPPRAQVEHFLGVVGDVKGKILMVDFEPYPPPYRYLTPGNDTLRTFLTELRRRVGTHPIVLYSGRGFWTGGDPSGPVSAYGNPVTWDAYYPSSEANPVDPKPFYKLNFGVGWGKRWGNQEPMFWQFTPAGKVAGLNLDVNAYRGTREQLLALTHAGGIPVPLVPPGFKPLPPRPSSANYEDRHPTRYQWREDVEGVIRRLYMRFGDAIRISTYHEHPGREISPNAYGRDTTSFDVWGPNGRNDPIGFELGQRVFDFVFNDPNPPWIDWCIWRRQMWVRGSGWQPFGTDPFSFHDDHLHLTFTGSYRTLP